MLGGLGGSLGGGGKPVRVGKELRGACEEMATLFGLHNARAQRRDLWVGTGLRQVLNAFLDIASYLVYLAKFVNRHFHE